MMYLLGVMEAQVVPVPKKKNWFQLTGREIICSDYAMADEFISDAEINNQEIIRDAKIIGMHDQCDLDDGDPRFDGSSDDSYAVVRNHDDTYVLVMDVNLPEYALFQYLLKHEDAVLPLEKTPAKKPAGKKAPAKKPAVAAKNVAAKKAPAKKVSAKKVAPATKAVAKKAAKK